MEGIQERNKLEKERIEKDLESFKLSKRKEMEKIQEEAEDDEAFEEKMKRLTAELSSHMKEGQKLDQEIKKNLESIGFKV